MTFVYGTDMARRTDAMHVATVKSRYVGKSGQERVYESHLLRRTFREDGKVKHETLALIFTQEIGPWFQAYSPTVG